MKKTFKWIGYISLSTLLIISIVILYIGTSTQIIDLVAQKYAPKYGFSYSKLSGSLITGVEVERLTFKDRELLERFNFSWNPATLLYKRVSITDIELKGLNIDSVKYTVDSFATDKKEKRSEKSELNLPLSISLDNIEIDTNPFIESGIEFKIIKVEVEDILFNNAISIGNFNLMVDSNITDISVNGSLEGQEVTISNLSLKDINSVAIEQIIAGLTSSDKKEESKKSSPNPLIPTIIILKSTDINLLPREYQNILLSDISLNSKNLRVNLSDNLIDIDTIHLNIESNITDISLDGSLKDREVTIDKLSVKELDVLALLPLFKSDSNSSSETNSSDSSSDNKMIPKRLLLKSLDATLKPLIYDPIKVNSLELNGTNIYFDIKEKMANSGELKLEVDTNLTTLQYDVNVSNNKINSRGIINPLKGLFERYKIPLRDGALEPIEFDLVGDSEKIDINIPISASRLLDVNDSEFNINSLKIINRVSYNILDSSLDMRNELNISTPYAKDIYINNILTLKDTILKYNGYILPNRLEGLDENLTAFVKDLKIDYSGDGKSADVKLNSDYIIGRFISNDFKRGDFNLSSKKALKFNDIVGEFRLSAPIDFNNTMPLNVKLDITSNMADIKSDIIYNKTINIKSIIDLDKKIDSVGVSPLRVNASIDKMIKATISSKSVNANIEMNGKSKDISGDFKLKGEEFKFSGNLEKRVVLQKEIKSIRRFIKKMQKLYKFEAPKVDGDVKLSLILENQKDIKLNLKSNKIKLRVDRKREHQLDDTELSLGFTNGDLTLNSYQTTFQKQKIFATKPSLIKLKESLVTISPLWINDELKVTGVYNLKDKSGDILAYANPLSITHEMVKIKSLINIKTKLKESEINIRGGITILGGRVYLDMDKRTFASSPDIIILQNIKPKRKKDNNIDLLLNIKSKKPLIYKTKEANIEINPNMVIQQTYGSPLQVLGSVEISDGSYYRFKDKKFVLKKSIIAFTGDPKNPILDISAVYNSINYEITIQITGDPQTPNIIFSSVPRLSREQILSVILFDNEDAGDSSSGEDMMKMMGGAIAKSALSGVGVKIDHLSLGSDGSMEVGKKISDRVTIIYVNDEVSSARLEYDWTKSIKASISSDGESSGADIIFRREF